MATPRGFTRTDKRYAAAPWREYFQAALKSPIVLFALGSMIVAAVGAPLFALADLIH